MAITEYEDKIKKIIETSEQDDFIYDFLSVYEKIPRATITKLRKGINNLAQNPGEVYLKNRLYFKVVSGNLMQVIDDLETRVNSFGSKPRYLFVTDFHHLLAKDLKTLDTLDIPFVKLPQNFEFFLAWNGIEKVDFDKENPADIRAAERFAKLYDVLVQDNQSISRHGLNLFLIRLLFCLFAEDTSIFKKSLFTNEIKKFTATDGSNLDNFIKQIFKVLDVKKENRPEDLPDWLNGFPYVDGQLFIAPHESLKFTAKSRQLIIDAGGLLSWDEVNPDILGSMLQAVASEDNRSHLGMHYTSVSNIMKVIKPLFLDSLREDFEKAKGNKNKLESLYDRIGKIKFMDPACGSGNFLIITYKELRQLEIDILKELNSMGISTMYLPSVTLHQFYGIEIDDFACDVTRLSLWIAEHQMNVQLHNEIHDAVRATLPLPHVGKIKCGNALRIDWNSFLPNSKDDEIYLFGNPPYLGYSLQDDSQKKDMKIAFENLLNYKRLDYISGWFYKAALFLQSSGGKFAFVTTNSLNQGEQVSIIWPHLLDKISIFFAYPSFKWSNNAANNAQVIVSIIGCMPKIDFNHQARIYDNLTYRVVNNINAYLVPGNNIIVKSTSKSIFDLPKITNGSRPVDGGYLILNQEEYSKLIAKYPEIKRAIKQIVGAKEFLNEKVRYAFWLDHQMYNEYSYIPELVDRVSKVKEFRNEGGDSAKSVKDIPWAFFLRKEFNKRLKEFHLEHDKDEKMLSIIIPRHSSGSRYYVPMGMFSEDILISDSAMAIYDAPVWLLGLLESRMHMIWLNMVGGKLKGDFRYSGDLVYNTFPVPELSSAS